MKRRPLGASSLNISAIGLGGNSLLDPRNAEFVATVHTALDHGINFFDSADFYGWGKSEEFFGTVLESRRDEAVVATKFGIVRNPEGGLGCSGAPTYVHRACDRSLQRLGMDHIDLYYYHRIDPDVPIEETFGAMGELVTAGKVNALGISNATGEQIRRAHRTHPLAALQTEYSLFTREPDTQFLPLCRELGIILVAYGPLGYAFFSGGVKGLEDIPESDGWRRSMPRFQDENIGYNLQLLGALEEVAAEAGATTGQVALAWILSSPYEVVPIPGCRSRAHLIENAGAADLDLTAAQREKLNAAFPEGVAKGGARGGPNPSIVSR